jgi:hypothetical protein
MIGRERLGREAMQWGREKNALGPCLAIENGMELRHKGEFVTLREFEEFGDHLAHRVIVHLTVEQV